MTWGEKIRNKRLKLGLSQEKAADCIGVSYPTLTKWEIKGVEPTAKYHPKIVAFINQ